MESEHLRVELQIGPDDDDLEELDQFTRELVSDLREQPVEYAEITRGGPAPPGTKGTEALLLAGVSNVVLGLAANVLWEVLKEVYERVKYRHNTIIKMDGPIAGQVVKFKGTPSELRKLLAEIEGRLEGPRLEPPPTA